MKHSNFILKVLSIILILIVVSANCFCQTAIGAPTKKVVESKSPPMEKQEPQPTQRQRGGIEMVAPSLNIVSVERSDACDDLAYRQVVLEIANKTSDMEMKMAWCNAAFHGASITYKNVSYRNPMLSSYVKEYHSIRGKCKEKPKLDSDQQNGTTKKNPPSEPKIDPKSTPPKKSTTISQESIDKTTELVGAMGTAAWGAIISSANYDTSNIESKHQNDKKEVNKTTDIIISDAKRISVPAIKPKEEPKKEENMGASNVDTVDW